MAELDGELGDPSWETSMRKAIRLAVASLGALGLSLTGVMAANAAEIESVTGPLTRIAISNDLNCDVSYLGDARPAFYSGTACATLVAVGEELYGPAAIPAGNSAGPRISWTPVNQTQGGSGTSADPYVINTTVTGGDLTLMQRDTYVSGENSYRTSITLTGDEAAAAVIYHGADCYLQDSDNGFGSHNAVTGAVTCRAPGDDNEYSTTTRIEEFVPLTAGSNYLYDGFDEVWAAIGTQNPLPDQVNADADGDIIDNAMALSWSVNVPAGGSTSVSMLTNFSTIGLSSLTTAITPTPDPVAVGGRTEVAATVTNPNLADQPILSVVVTIPVNTVYVPGSTEGAAEPAVSGETLTFANAGTSPGAGALTFTFELEGVAVGTGTLTLEGTTVSGAPVVGSTATLSVESGDVPVRVEVSPAEATVVQGSCPAPGSPVGPSVTLPTNTPQIAYSLTGDVVAGATVEVAAQAQTGFIFPAAITGWTISSDRMSATASVQLAANPCAPEVVISPVAPATPAVIEATCTAGPSITLAKTEGVQYTVSPQSLKAGDKVTVTAQALEGFELVAAAGWTLDEETGIATWSKTLAAAPTDCKTAVLAATGANLPSSGLIGTAAIMLTMGGFLLYRKSRLA